MAAAKEWSWEEDKAFESAVATVPRPPALDKDGADAEWLEMIASRVPERTADEVRIHYEALVEDVKAIESGKVPIPRYAGEESAPSESQAAAPVKDGNGHKHPTGGSTAGKASSKAEQDRRKGTPWTEEEHRLFLLGLEKYGKGDWRSISRNFVISRTPTQVASHAQKYFIRLNSINRDRRRSSIHDITSANGGADAAPPSAPVTGQPGLNPAATARPPPQPAVVPAIGIYGPPLGHPVAPHMVSAVGTPVMFPPGHSPYVVPVGYPAPPPPANLHQHQ